MSATRPSHGIQGTGGDAAPAQDAYEAKRAKALAMGGRRSSHGARLRACSTRASASTCWWMPGRSSSPACSAHRRRGPRTATNRAADGKIAGFGKIDGRECAVVANDFTVMGASSQRHQRPQDRAHEARGDQPRPAAWCSSANPPARACPITWARAAWALCSATTRRSTCACARRRGCRRRSAISYGSSSWYAVLSDFSVMRKGAVLAVSSALLASLAIKEAVDPEEMGGWKRARRGDGLRRCRGRHRRGGDGGDQDVPVLSAVPQQGGAARQRPVPPGSGEAMARHRQAAAREAHAGLRRAQHHPRHRRQGQLLRAQGRASARWR